MNIKEFEKVLNDRIKERNVTPNGKNVLEIVVKDVAEEILGKDKYQVHKGFYHRTKENKNKLYVEPVYKNYWASESAFMEIQLHKSISGYSRFGAVWALNKVTVKSVGEREITVEEAYNELKERIDKRDKEIAEERAREKIEEERRAKEREETFNNIKSEVLNYLKDNNLDPVEFAKIADKFYTYNSTFINGKYEHIIDYFELK